MANRVATILFEIWGLEIVWDLEFGIWDFRLCIGQYVNVRVRIPLYKKSSTFPAGGPG